jgi:hypothetical protein
MVEISEGMTRQEVADLIGPPLSTSTKDEFLSSFEGVAVVSDDAVVVGKVDTTNLPNMQRLIDNISWSYVDYPQRGMFSTVFFRAGRVAEILSSPEGRPLRKSIHHEWARRLIQRHALRVESDARFRSVTVRDGWRELMTQEAVDFALSATRSAFPPFDGRIGCEAHRLENLLLLISMFDAGTIPEIRRSMPGGYWPHYDQILERFCIRLGELDVAHWIMGRDETNKKAIVQLCYLSAEPETTAAIVPQDLL